jgi:hypothetical protein
MRASLVWANVLCAAAFAALSLTVTANPALVVWIALPALGGGIRLGLGNELLIVQAAVQERWSRHPELAWRDHRDLQKEHREQMRLRFQR